MENTLNEDKPAVTLTFRHKICASLINVANCCKHRQATITLSRPNKLRIQQNDDKSPTYGLVNPIKILAPDTAALNECK
jgi:hypothetical protein